VVANRKTRARPRGKRHPWRVTLLVLLLFALAMAAVGSHGKTQTTSTPPPAQIIQTTAASQTPAALAASRQPSAKASPAKRSSAGKATSSQRSTTSLSLLTEPNGGPQPLYNLLSSAHHSLDMVIYELEDSRACAVLAADASRGVRVRVLLDHRFIGRYNETAFSYLAHHGVAVRWAPSHFDLTHEKAIVVDNRLAAIMTLNLTARYYDSTRDFALLDRNSADVAAIETTFSSDWSGGSSAGTASRDLVWSPGAEQTLVNLIASARHSLLIENEEMKDSAVISALQTSARRGVRVEVVMTRATEWSRAFSALSTAGVAVRTYAASAPLYIHAKVIVVDAGSSDARVFVGSQNFSVTSLTYNRELGIITAAPTIVNSVAAVVRDDAAAATPWR
jgi:phosphatidylserine/phosphatidylglycerophosphate/cardiolipin synthase-like enzyme